MLPNMLLGRSRALVLVFAGILAGCAIGAATEEDNYDEDGIGGEEPTDAGGDVRDGGAGGKGGGSKADAADGSGDGGEDDAGLDGGDADGGDGDEDAGPVDPCEPVNSCADPTHVGRVRGDDGSDTIVVQGTRPQWFRVQVDEVDSSVVGEKVKVRATLSSPPGKNFDLFAYRKASCGSPSAWSENYSTEDKISLEWGEGAVSNGKDDSEAIHLEVRWKSGHVCAEDAPFTLKIEGNKTF